MFRFAKFLLLPVLLTLDAGRAAPTPEAPVTHPAGPAIVWEPWSPDVFARAKKDHKFVLMDLQAVWCHWCHVMDQVTYRDPDVIKLIGERYIAVKVDQDSRPDISNRYEDYGWPATVVFNAEGGEIVKRQGYIPPRPMARMLQAIIDDPTPGPSVQPEKAISFAAGNSLAPLLRQELQDKLSKAYDAKLGGWGTIHKFIDWDALEYTMRIARGGDADAEKQARQTLTAGLKLIDPVWGGVYQYSVEGDWDHPHFEKLVQFQSEIMRIYALAYATFKDPSYLRAAQLIHDYLDGFLRSGDGAFAVSQDADLHEGEYAEKYFAMDDAHRRAEGMPRIDTHYYARENGWAIGGLVCLYEWGGDASALADARVRPTGSCLTNQSKAVDFDMAKTITAAPISATRLQWPERS